MKSPAPDDDKTSGLATGLLIFGAILAFAYLPKLFGHAEGNMAGKDAPELALKLVANAPSDSNDVSLAALRGHTVLLDFWATWCGPCRAEAPIVNKIAQRYHDQGLAVIGVNTSDQSGTAAQYAKGHGLTYPIALDPGDRAATAFGVESLPTLVVISKTGKVTAFRSGTTSEAELDEMVQREL
jgi:thiol-disulfide isomerase/thioredoxin